MTNKCIECGNSKSITDFSKYAGLDVRKEGGHAFPNRIFPPSLIGNIKTDFLCSKCVSSIYNVECSFHGRLKNQLWSCGNPPTCDRCTSELNEINKGRVPSRYEAYVPLSSIILRPNKKVENAFFVISNDGDGHFILNKKVIFSDKLINFDFKVLSDSADLLFEIDPVNHQYIENAKLTVNLQYDFKKLPKGWLTPWKPFITKKLKLKSGLFSVCLCSLTSCIPGKSRFGRDKNSGGFTFVSINENEISTFPYAALPDLKNLCSWSLTSDSSNQELDIEFIREDKTPCLISIKQTLLAEDFEPVGALATHLQQNKRSISQINKALFKGCKTTICIHPHNRDEDVLLYLESKFVSVKILSSNKTILFTHGCIYKNCCLLVNDNREYATLDLNTANETVVDKLEPLTSLQNSINSSFFVLFEKSEKLKGCDIILNSENVITESSQTISYSEMRPIRVIPQNDGFSEIQLDYTSQNAKTNLKCYIAPSDYAYLFYKSIEINRIQNSTKNKPTVALYKEYHRVKKQNMLLKLFLGLISLNRQLNCGTNITDFYKELKSIEPEKFLESKNLFQSAIEKLIILSVALPILKQEYEYLALFYPYFQFETDIKIFESGFGKDMAKRVRYFERRRRVEDLRKRVRHLQATVQRPLAEIERALYPIEQLLAIEEMRRKFSARFLKYFPFAAQAALVGTMVITGVATGGVSILAGMLGINAIRELLSDEQGNKEKAAKIKRACETVFSWWKVLNDTLPVLVFEISDSIDIENQSTMNRDQEYFRKLPAQYKQQAAQQLNHELKKHIVTGTQIGFEEVLRDNGIYYSTLVSELENTIKEIMSHTPNDSLRHLQMSLLASSRS